MKRYSDWDEPLTGATVAFGAFDGVHLGHRAVIEVLSQAKSPVIISFYEEDRPFIYSEDEKAEVIERVSGGRIEAMYSVPAAFGESLSDFFESVLSEIFEAQEIIIGENNSLRAEIEVLATKYGMKLTLVPEITGCTTMGLKEALCRGSLEEIRAIQGHPYVLIGPIVHGKAIGRKAGLPTANLQISRCKLLPTLGVYGARVHLGERVFKGMTNIGPRPTVDDEVKPTVETFILDFDEDCYGEIMTLEMLHYVRGTRKFNSLDEVKSQVDRDIETIKAIEGE